MNNIIDVSGYAYMGFLFTPFVHMYIAILWYDTNINFWSFFIKTLLLIFISIDLMKVWLFFSDKIIVKFPKKNRVLQYIHIFLETLLQLSCVFVTYSLVFFSLLKNFSIFTLNERLLIQQIIIKYRSLLIVCIFSLFFIVFLFLKIQRLRSN